MRKSVFRSLVGRIGAALGVLRPIGEEVFISDETLADGSWGRDLTTRRHAELIGFLREEKVPADARILDVGSSWGFLAKALHHHGYRNLWGCDRIPGDAGPRPGKPFQDYRGLMRYTGVDLNRDKLAPFEPDSFDVIICSEVLEHLEAPGAMLKEFQRTLKPGGLVFMEVPNPQNIFERLRFMHRGQFKRFRPKLRPDHTGHISIITSDILMALCARCDLKIERIHRSFVVWDGYFVLPHRGWGLRLSYGANYLLRSTRNVAWADYPHKDFHGSGIVVWQNAEGAMASAVGD